MTILPQPPEYLDYGIRCRPWLRYGSSCLEPQYRGSERSIEFEASLGYLPKLLYLAEQLSGLETVAKVRAESEDPEGH